MSEQKHIINRQVLELTIPERERAQHIQNLASEIVRKKLLRALDKLFTGVSGSDEILRIDKLEIDLGIISENELENELVDRVVKEIETKINIQMITGSKTANYNFVKGKNVGIKNEFTTTSKSRSFLDQFIYFLQAGHLPWWHSSTGTELTGYIFKEALNIEKSVFNSEVIPLLRKPKVRQRLIFQLNHSQLHTFLKKLNEKLLESYTVQFQYLYSFFNSGIDKKTLKESFYEITLLYFSMELELSTDELKIGFIHQILSSVLSKLPENEKERILLQILNSEQLKQQKSFQKETLLILTAVIQSVTSFPSHSEILVEIIRNLPVKNDTGKSGLIEQFLVKVQENVSVKTDVKTEESAISAIQDSREFENINKKENHTKPVLFSTQHSFSDEEQTIVFNAGLVLVHPFLKYFFEGLNLLDKDLMFKSQSEAFKAVHLLQFIATGMELTEENDLPLNKILCGLDISEPVPKNVLLSEEEKEECIFLIKTLLERWEALKTTNPAALRETYLQRDGILKSSGQSWTLVVERNTFDIMLEKLPWSYSLVKLPWCEQILYVEW
jgi:hypothetical protein